MSCLELQKIKDFVLQGLKITLLNEEIMNITCDLREWCSHKDKIG